MIGVPRNRSHKLRLLRKRKARLIDDVTTRASDETWSNIFRTSFLLYYAGNLNNPCRIF
jgi:hypothetical protein